MRILREITVISLAFLLALLPVQEVLGKKVRIGVVNNKKYRKNIWECLFDDQLYSITYLFNSSNGRENFDSFTRAVKDKFRVTKIIEIPDPRKSDFVPTENLFDYSALDYLDLKTGNYKSDCSSRHLVKNAAVSFEVRTSSRSLTPITERVSFYYFEVEEEEAAEINESLIFN
ncbi:MAG: hypothetical protein LBL71_01425, partial [Endomicrobium sp.]|nr:hypothetical protein [Endomicrobium sp.]